MDPIRKAVMTLNGLAALLEGVMPETPEGRPTFLKDTIDWMDTGDPDAFQKGFVAGIRKMDAKAREQFADATGVPRALLSEVARDEPENKPRKSSEIREDLIKAIPAKYDRGAEAVRDDQ